MSTSRTEYLVTTACYVPVEGVGLKYKHPGQVVTLSRRDAAPLEGFVEPLGGSAPPAKKVVAVKPPKKGAKETVTSTEESSSLPRHSYADRLRNSDVVGPPLDTPRESDAG